MENPQRFGQRLRVLRGEMSVDELSTLSGVAPHTLRRIEKGQIEKPSFSDVVAIGQALGLAPNEIAAAADLWALPETIEEMRLDPQMQSIERLTQYMATLDAEGRARMATLIDMAILVDKQRRSELSRGRDPLTALLRREQTNINNN